MRKLLLAGLFSTALASGALANYFEQNSVVGTTKVHFFGTAGQFIYGVTCIIEPGAPTAVEFFLPNSVTPLVPFVAHPGMVVPLGPTSPFDVKTSVGTAGVSCNAAY